MKNTEYNFMIDDWFQTENRMSEYEDAGLCDDCVGHEDMSRKRVKCVGWDGLYFCQKHWMNYAKNMFIDEETGLPTGDVIEPFEVSRSTLFNGFEIKEQYPEKHKKSNC